MLNMRERQSLTAEIVRRYQRARKLEKTAILDEFIKNTGYNRSYARRAIAVAKTRDFRVKKRIHRVRPHIYIPGVILKPLSKLWDISNFICGKRLAPLIPDYLFVLRRDRIWDYPTTIDEQLKKISAATIDRLLTPIRKKMTLKGRTMTKPGTLLKHQIPVRTWSDWNEQIPGFFEADTVAFCGSNLSGDFAWGIDMTDVCVGWVLLEISPNRGQHAIHEGMKAMMKRLVYLVLGIDSDNGGEFINDILYRFCLFMRITFTRTRAGKKNDNCYVEQKNFTSLRTFLGYLRIETEEQITIAREILELAEIFINFFQSSTKLISKERIGTRNVKHYDKALTPYKRLLKLGILSKRQRRQLYKVYSTHNPQELTQKIRVLQDKLRRACSVTI